MEQIKLKEFVESWNDAKEKASHFDKLAEKNKLKVIEYMTEHNLDTIKTENFIVTKRQMTRDSVNKSDLPEDIWKKYHKSSTYNTYSIKER